MADAYSYEALPSDTHIRYLLLQPGESRGKIVCSLHVTEIKDPTPFEAISYAWGVPERTEPIQCDGKTLCVTVNLRDALVAVRLLHEARALWVDSICINQGDNAEKAQQVSHMADIYRKSTRTLICIGLNDDGGHAEAVSGILTTVNRMMDETFQDKNFSWKPNSFPCLPAGDPLASDPRWKSVTTLLAQPWFKRYWVVQEAALGPVAEIIWGSVHIDWFHLLRAFFWMIAKAEVLRRHFQVHEVSGLHLMAYERRQPLECIALESAGYPHSWPFLQNLNFGRSLGATDPRDRIYACFSLPHSTTFQGPQVTALKPDYNKSHLQVYHDFACAYLEATGMCLDLLEFTENGDYTGIPADGPSTAFVGTLVGKHVREDLHEWERREAAYMDYVDRRARQQVGGTEGDTISSTVSEEDEEDNAASFVEDHRFVMATAHNRKLIVSDRGYYGLAPSAVEKGDAIYIIFGTTSPFLLRQTSNAGPGNSAKYKLVGEMFMFSAVGAGSGKRLVELGKAEGYDDWHDWGLQEESILIC